MHGKESDDLADVERRNAELIKQMQTPEQQRGVDALFRMTGAELNRAASLQPAEGCDGDDRPVHEWWWDVSEEEREFFSGLSAAAAREWDDPERLFTRWRGAASLDAQQRYVVDLIERVRRHLQEGTGAIRVDD